VAVLVELVVPVAMVGMEELEVRVVPEAQVALEAKVVLEVLVPAQEAHGRNHRCQYTLWQSLHCIVHQSRQMDIRHKWKRRPIYSSNIARPLALPQVKVIPWRVQMGSHWLQGRTWSLLT